MGVCGGKIMDLWGGKDCGDYLAGGLTDGEVLEPGAFRVLGDYVEGEGSGSILGRGEGGG